jgi:glycosyltransferase involved in cell wall biosynthesis
MGASHVTILMCTRNGARYLPDQLASFAAQSHADWSLRVSDDGSTDGTHDILTAFRDARPPGRVHILTGPQNGSAANFLSLLDRAGAVDGPVAFSDQDDVWLPHKLARALQRMTAAAPLGAPVVYSSRTLHVGPDLGPGEGSPHHRRPPALANALVQNILSGHTLTLNAAAAQRIRRTVPAALAAGVPFHDWWIYIAAAALGLHIEIDDEPGVKYRQHSANLMGASRGGRSALARARMLFGGAYRGWVDRNLAALAALPDPLPPENAALLAEVARWRQRPWPLRGLTAPRRLGLYRQTTTGDVMLDLAGRLGRL